MERNTRRTFLKKLTVTGSSLMAAGYILMGCGSSAPQREKPKSAAIDDPCRDFTDVPREELEKREKMGYTDKSQLPEASCANCSLYLPYSAESACGKCLLFKGPVYAEGHCLQWAAKITS